MKKSSMSILFLSMLFSLPLLGQSAVYAHEGEGKDSQNLNKRHEVASKVHAAKQEESALKEQVKGALKAGDVAKAKELHQQLKTMHQEHLGKVQEHKKKALESAKNHKGNGQEKLRYHGNQYREYAGKSKEHSKSHAMAQHKQAKHAMAQQHRQVKRAMSHGKRGK